MSDRYYYFMCVFCLFCIGVYRADESETKYYIGIGVFFFNV